MKKKTNLCGPARYQIEVYGQLDEEWSDWFEGAALSGNQGRTIIISNMLDQSGLHGLLVRICDLGLPLLSLERLEPEDENIEKKRWRDE